MKIKELENEANQFEYILGKYFYALDRAVVIHSFDEEYNAVVNDESKSRQLVSFKADFKSGDLLSFSCSCNKRNICGHVIAAVMKAQEEYGKPKNKSSNKKGEKSTGTSAAAIELIKLYNRMNLITASKQASSDIPKTIKLIPYLKRNYDGFFFELRISCDGSREYLVNDLGSLKSKFDECKEHQYGKKLVMVHSYQNLDEKSLALLKYTDRYSEPNPYPYYNPKKNIELDAHSFIDLLLICKGDSLHFNDDIYSVEQNDPEIEFFIDRTNENEYSIKCGSFYKTIEAGDHIVWIDDYARTIQIASEEFNSNVRYIYTAVKNNKKVNISAKDMPDFYSSVIRSAKKSCTFHGLDNIDIPVTDCVAQIYIDALEDRSIVARLQFAYGDRIYEAFSEKSERLCDFETEFNCEALAGKYFVRNDDTKYPLVITDESMIYNFCSVGIDELMSLMEIYATERFRSIKIRQPARPVIGIRPESSLLELSVTEENYSAEELTELLAAYRKGAKYYRLRDGSFAGIDSGLAEFAELSHGLNISDKAWLKERISVPVYRMLYLDNLASDSSAMRIKRNNKFKNMVSEYRMMAEDSENIQTPAVLGKIMRDYQQYGFRWMKTIEKYKFGGILADDMGLGKTLQAISLMLDVRNNSSEHRTNLVVCPASLTLNWANEIQKFAPELTAAVLNGTSAERKVLLSEYEKYDVMITSYSVISRDIAEYEDIKFYMQFIDEAQYIKNHSTQAAKAVKGIRSEIRYALTGTPVENSLSELWSIFDYIMPGYLYGYTVFKKNFETPIVKNEDRSAVSELQKIVSPFILRRLKKEVLTELPEKTESLMYSEMTKEQSKLYSANVLALKKSLKGGIKDEKERIKILAMITRLRQVCCDPAIAYDEYSGGSGKLDLCCELTEECINAGHKILIFSQFTSMLDVIAERFRKMNISYFMLTGSVKPAERIKMVNSFNKDDTSVFLISLKAGGTGLNLTGADIVIHYDPWWNVSAENQASDRVYRIGQKNNVQIFKLISKNTIEEKICELQKSKAELAELAVGGEGNIMRMSAEEIVEILG